MEIKTELKDFQIKSVNFVKEYEKKFDGGFLLHEPGLGKCHGHNTPILMFNGTIKMVQDIQVGELLMGDDSTPRKVLSLARGEDEMYDIIPIKGEKYTVNQEHILCLKISGKPLILNTTSKKYKDYNGLTVKWFENKKWNTKTFSSINKQKEAEIFIKTINHQEITEITVKDYLQLTNNVKKDLKGYKVSIEFQEQKLNFDPYILGLWLGDGSSDGTGFTNQDAPILHYLANNLPKYNCYLQFQNNSGNYYYRINGEKIKGKQWNENMFLNELKEQNLINNKHIPMIYKCNSRENRLKLLAGLLDSDGSLVSDNCTFDFSQKSEKLIDDVIYLCRSLGFACYKSKQKKGCWYLGEYKEGDYYRISISGDTNEIPTLCRRKQANKRKQIKDVLVTGIKVKHVGRDKYYGFEIDGNRRYVMGDYTVTHNTLIMLSVICNSPLKTLIICPSGLIDNWINEIKKHTNISRLKVLKYYGNDRHNYSEIIDKQLIYITSYSIISREYNNGVFDENSLINKIKIERIILDEAHYIRNTNTSVYKSINYLGENNLYAKKWIVTATPIFNDVKDAYAYFKFVGLENIDSKKEWKTLLKDKGIYGLRIINNLMDKYSISYKKKDVLTELKEKIDKKIILNFTEIENEFYNTLIEYSQIRMKALMMRIKKLNKKVLDNNAMKQILRSNIMVYILRLRQACNNPMLILRSMERLKKTVTLKDAIQILDYFNKSKNESEECPICYDSIANYIAKPCGHKCCNNCWIKMQNSGIVNCPKCRVYVGEIQCIEEELEESKDEQLFNIDDFSDTSKINYIIDLTNKVIKNNEKIVIVSQWVSMLNIIRAVMDKTHLKNKYISLQGDISMKDRTKILYNFQTNDSLKICFISLMSSSEGLTITTANHLVLVDSWYNEAKMIQVSDRIHRIGQNKQTYIYRLQIENSIEDKIEQLVKKKSKISNLIMNKWNISDTSKYDDKWISEIIKLIEKPIIQET